MSNRRTGRPKASKKTAPRDPTSSYEDGVGELPRSGGLRWLILATKVTLGLSLIVGAVGALAWGVQRYARTTPRFSVKNIELTGTSRLVRADVLAAAHLKKGKNLFSLDVEEAETFLLESPWISSAQVTRRLPNTINVRIVEREAKAIALIDGKNFLVDQEGSPFKELGLGDPHDLPVVTGISTEALARDKRAELARLGDTLALLRKYDKLSMARAFPVEEVHLTSTGSVSLLVGTSGVTLHLGAPPWKRKLLRAERVLTKTNRAGGSPSVVFLDNDAHPERVVVRVR